MRPRQKKIYYNIEGTVEMKTAFLMVNMEGNGSIPKTVYCDTLLYIRYNIQNSCILNYENDTVLIDYIEKNDISIVVTTNEIPYPTLLLLKGLNVVLIMIGLQPGSENLTDDRSVRVRGDLAEAFESVAARAVDARIIQLEVLPAGQNPVLAQRVVGIEP